MNSVTGLALNYRNSEEKAALRVLVTLELQANRGIRVNVYSFQRREESAGKINSVIYLLLRHILKISLKEFL